MKQHPARTKIIRFLKANPEASVRDIQAAAGLSSTSVADYHLGKLMAAGKLKRVAPKWEVAE